MTASGESSATTTYAYDHTEQRVKKVGNGVTTIYPNKYYNIEGTTITKYIFAGDELVASIKGGSGGGTPLLDTTSTSITNGFNAGPTTKTWTHTVTGQNPLITLSADIFQDVAGTGSITSATWNGGVFTKATSTRLGTKSAEMWYLVATTTGAKIMSVTITGATDEIKLSASSFTNITPTSPLDSVSVSTGSSGNPSVNLTTSTTNDLVVTTLHRHSTTDATTNRTSLYKNTSGSTLGASSYQLATSPNSYSDTYTGSANQNWAMVIASFKPASGSTATSTTYIHSDHLGSTNATTDATGYTTKVLDYYPYGNERISSGSDTQQRTYIGQYSDPESNLSYLNARYYEGVRGQFLSEDPVHLAIGNDNQVQQITGKSQQAYLTDPQSLNSYSYGRDNPITNKDPNGTCAWDACVIEGTIATSPYWAPAMIAGATAIYLGTEAMLRNVDISRWGGQVKTLSPENLGIRTNLDPFDNKPLNTDPKGWKKWAYIGLGVAGIIADKYNEYTQQGQNQDFISKTSSSGSSNQKVNVNGGSNSSYSSAINSASNSINAASAAINRGDYSAASRYLNNATQSLRKIK
jgi:RHS repeat-associated protein